MTNRCLSVCLSEEGGGPADEVDRGEKTAERVCRSPSSSQQRRVVHGAELQRGLNVTH